jgi:hypothetical protein
MNQLRSKSYNNFTDILLHYIWKNWCSLGVFGTPDPEVKEIIDIEALLLLTCSVGRCDPRLFDEVMDWLTVNWELINVNRIKHMLKKYSWSGERALRAVAAWMLENQGKLTKWSSLATIKESHNQMAPFFIEHDGSINQFFGIADPSFSKYGFARGELVLRGYSRPFLNDNPACLLLSLRSFFGTNVRAEIITYLLTHHEGAHPSAIAREIGYYQKTVQNALVAMKQSQWVNCRDTSQEKIYTLDTSMSKSFLGTDKNSLKWMNIVPIYCLLERIWEKVHNPEFSTLSVGIQSIELRESVMPLIKDINQPDLVIALSGQLRGEIFIDTLFAGIIKFIE